MSELSELSMKLDRILALLEAQDPGRGELFEGIDHDVRRWIDGRGWPYGDKTRAAIESFRGIRVLYDNGSLSAEDTELLLHNEREIGTLFPATVWNGFTVQPCVDLDGNVIEGLLVRPSFLRQNQLTRAEIRGMVIEHARNVVRNAYYEDRGRGPNVGQG